MTRAFFSMIVIVVFTTCTADENTQTRKKSLQSLLDRYTKENLLPGVILYIRTPGETFYLSSGLQNIPYHIPMKTQTLAYPQSISKSFTAVSILKLQEEEQLSIDDKMNVYLSADICDHLANGNSITIRQLLNHTSGIKDYVYSQDFRDDLSNGNLFPMTKEKVLRYVYDKPADFSPGTAFGYADTNYHLLAMIIDEVTGQHHGAYFQSEIIDKLNLHNTFYLPYRSPEEYEGRSYYFNPVRYNYDDVTETQFNLTEGGIGADGLLCEAKDLATFYTSLLEEGTLLNCASLEEMKRIVISGKAYGMGLIIQDFGPGGLAYGHSGGGLGGGGHAYYFPDKFTSIVLLINTGLLEGPKSDVTKDLLHHILNNIF